MVVGAGKKKKKKSESEKFMKRKENILRIEKLREELQDMMLEQNGGLTQGDGLYDVMCGTGGKAHFIVFSSF